MDVKLIVVGGKASKNAISLKLPSVIGRSREADLTVSHPMVSRRHCEILQDEGLLWVRDLGSLNGTVVDGQRVSQAALRPHDQFTVGPLTFQADYRYDGSLDVLPAPTLDHRAAQPRDAAEHETPDPKTLTEESGDPLAAAPKGPPQSQEPERDGVALEQFEETNQPESDEQEEVGPEPTPPL